uniref:PorV/PorQ family protein n=1 Tax=candidate division WOR-3 bacterium TaxID=2052148 RepID=A0A7C4X846_UNCW3
MNLLVIFFFTASGLNSLLLPASPGGVLSFFAHSEADEAIFYNPTNLEAGEDFRVSFFYNNLYVSTRSFSLSLSKKVKTLDFGIGVNNFDYGNMELHPDYPSEDTTINYQANDFSLIFCGSAWITRYGKLGINLKYISENIYIYSDWAIASDLSLAYCGETGKISFGATNIGSKITIHNEEVDLPAKLSLGMLKEFRKIVFCSDLHYLINTGQFEFSLGGEIPFGGGFKLGISANYHQHFYPGFNLVFALNKIEIRYGGAIYPYHLGLINSFGISFLF